MQSSENALPALPGTSVHRLEGQALRRWWQIPRLGRAQKNDATYANAGMQQLISTLITLPFMVAYCYLNQRSPVLVVPAMIFGCCLFIMLLWLFRRHRYHVLAVTTSEAGVELRSPFLQRNIRWLEIQDFFPAGTVDPREFVLQCRNGEEFLLSKDLTDSKLLFDTITRRMSRPETSYEINYRLPDGLLDSFKICVFAVVACAVWSIAFPWFSGTGATRTDPATVIVMGSLATIVLSWCWLQLKKMPQLLRAGPTGLYVRTGRQIAVLSWEQITRIRKFAGWLIINSRSGWFVIVADSKEPMTQRLLECKNNLLLLKEKNT